MATQESTTPKRSRRAASPKSTPIDPKVKPTVEQFEANTEVYSPIWRIRHNVGAPIVERKVAEKPMDLPTGIQQPTDENGNVVKTQGIVEKDDEKVIESIIELLGTFPQAQTSWVAALRTARWTRKAKPEPIKRADGTFYLSCTTKRWGCNHTPGLYHVALERFMAAPKKASAKKAPAKSTTTTRRRKTA
jgi:hypothetical protein